MIEIKNLTAEFDKTKVLNGVSFEIDRGITVIKGPSGRGKTTLFRCIAGLEKYSGEILLPHGAAVSIAFQDIRLFDSVSVYDNIRLTASKETDTEKLMRDFFVFDFKDKYPGELSQGMKQRVSLARAFGKNASIILLDEPFNGLDRELKSKIIKSIVSRSKDKYLLVITHVTEDIELLCPDKIIEL